MARQLRKKSGTGIYHVMLRGINQQDIFEDEDDYRQMLSILRAQTRRYDKQGSELPPYCIIYAYCLMSNHIHLLVHEREENISDAMKRVGVIYAQYFNKKYHRSGHLFQDRFRSEPVGSVEYFLTLLRYIHQNPLKAGLVEKVDDYKWSSWEEYKMDYVAAPLCATKTVLNRFSKQELTEFVCTPIEEYHEILDIDNEAPRQLSDDEVKSFLLRSFGIENPLMVQSLDKVRRNEILISARVIGAGMRQLARLTGVSFGVVQKCCKDQK